MFKSKSQTCHHTWCTQNLKKWTCKWTAKRLKNKRPTTTSYKWNYEKCNPRSNSIGNWLKVSFLPFLLIFIFSRCKQKRLPWHTKKQKLRRWSEIKIRIWNELICLLLQSLHSRFLIITLESILRVRWNLCWREWSITGFRKNHWRVCKRKRDL